MSEESPPPTVPRAPAGSVRMRRRPESRPRIPTADPVGDLLLIAVLALASSIAGLVHTPTIALVGLLAVGALGRSVVAGRSVAAVPPPLLIAFGAAALGLLLSALPMPRSFLGVLSPGSAEIYALGPVDAPPPTDLRPLHLAPSMGLDRAARWAAALAWALLCMSQAPLPSYRRLLRAGILLGGTLAMSVGVVHTLLHERALFGLWRPRADPREDWLWPMINSNHWGAFLALVATFGLDLATNPRVGRALRLVAFPVSLPAVAFIVLGDSLSSILGLAFGLVSLVVFRGVAAVGDAPKGGRRWRAVATLAFATPIVLALLFARVQHLGRSLEFADNGRELPNSGLLAKAHLYEAVAGVIGGHPWLGVGPGALIDVIPRYDKAGMHLSYPWAESLPLQLLADLGVPLGLCVFGALLWALWMIGRDALRRWENHGVAAALIGLGVHELFDFALAGGAVAFTAIALAAAGLSTRDVRKLGGPRALAALSILFLVCGAAASLARPREASDALLQARPGIDAGHESLDAAAARLQARYPSSPVLALDLAELYVERDRWSTALQWMNRAQWLAPHSTAPHLATARLLAAAGHERQAAIEYGLAVELDWRHQGEAILGEAIDRLQDAEVLASLAGPGHPETLARLAWLLRVRRDVRAEAVATIAAEAAPDVPLTDLVRARSHLAAERKEEAARLARALLQRDGCTSWLRLRALEVLWWSGARDEAREDLRSMLEGAGARADAEGWLLFGQWSHAAGRAQDARVGFRRARAGGGPSLSAQALLAEARANIDDGRPGESHALLTRAERLDGGLVEVHLVAAQLFEAEGRIDAARERVRRAMQLRPHDQAVQDAVVRFGLQSPAPATPPTAPAIPSPPPPAVPPLPSP